MPPVNINSKPVNVLKRSHGLGEECYDSVTPIKKYLRRRDAVDLESLMMANSSEEKTWLKFGRQILTETDKLMIIKGLY